MAQEEEGQEMTKSHNLVASTPPFYMPENMVFDEANGSGEGEIVLDPTSGDFDPPYEGNAQGWEFDLKVVGTDISGTFYTRDQFFLTGLYDQEKILYPVGNNIQTAEPPLWRSKNSDNKYLREVELWTTQKLTEAEILRAVHAFIPILPGFPSSDNGPEAYLDSEQVIAGRSRTYSGNANLNSILGFGSLIHESIIGEGEPVACPDLHYVRAYYMYAEFQYAPGWTVIDLPSARDILSVVEMKATDDRQWMTQVIRGAALDVN